MVVSYCSSYIHNGVSKNKVTSSLSLNEVMTVGQMGRINLSNKVPYNIVMCNVVGKNEQSQNKYLRTVSGRNKWEFNLSRLVTKSTK